VRRLSALASAVSMSLLTSAAFAAEVAEKSLPPQIDFANPLTKSQVVWLGLIFLTLYLLLDRWALPRVGEVLEARAARIAGDLEAAQAAKLKSDEAVAEVLAATKKAQAEAQAAVNAAAEAAKAEAASQAANANARLDAQLSAAEARINAARAAAMGALREVAADATADVVTRLTGVVMTTETIENAVDRALAARAA